MRANVRGRVHNTRLSIDNALYPLFEAIVNSIDAIEDSGQESADGVIEVTVLRDPALPVLNGDKVDERIPGNIYGFEVRDNGIGFAPANFDSFNESDTQFKASRGGKGIGRFLWLKAFERVEIDSVFKDNERFLHRTFTFSLLTDDGITDHQLGESSETDSKSTTVSLIELKERYRPGIPRKFSTIAERIVEHCLEYFVLQRMPSVTLYDGEEEPILLHLVYKAMVANSVQEQFELKGNHLHLIHFMLTARANLKHRVSYCAHRRVVETMLLGNKIPHLPSTINFRDDDASYVYAAYVSSDYLDQHVNQERTRFYTLEEDGIPFPSELTRSEIDTAVLTAVQDFLQPYTEEVREQTYRQAEEYVKNEAPQFRLIVDKHPEVIDTIPPNVSAQELDTRLYEAYRNLEVQTRNQANELLQQKALTDGQPDEKQFEEFMDVWVNLNEIGKATLAKYIVHRKAMLSFLENALRLQDTGRYSREEAIHRIIFPLRSTSDDVAYDQHNLWIIDEKLAYHEYLSSDVPLNQVKSLQSDSRSRPDLLIFNGPIAVVEEEPPYNSGIVIFEFKRPMRDDYGPNENPIAQILGYVREIKKGETLDRTGRTVRVAPSAPFYCYVVCDLTPKLVEQAENAGLRQTPDVGGYFGYNDAVGAYIEVIDFTKLLSDAKKRNRILFEKLNLPT